MFLPAKLFPLIKKSWEKAKQTSFENLGGLFGLEWVVKGITQNELSRMTPELVRKLRLR